MRRITSCSVFAAALLATSAPGWAAQTVGPLSVQPTQVVAQTPTPVTVTTTISDPSYLAGSANLQRRGANGVWTVVGTLHDDSLNGDAVAGDHVYSLILNVNEPTTNVLHLRASAAFRGLLKRVLSPEVTLPVGVVLQPSDRAQTISGPTGLRLTVPPNALTEPAFLGIAPTLAPDFPAPTGNLPVIKTLDLIVRSEGGGDGVSLTKPLQLSLLAPAGTAQEDRFYIAQPLFTGTEQKLLATDTATLVGGQIVTQSTNLAGTFGGGPTVILKEIGSGYAKGKVNPGVPFQQDGVLVFNNTNNFVFLTDADGNYILPISGSPPATFTVSAVNATCGRASVNGGLIPLNDNVVDNLNLITSESEFLGPTRPGIHHGGFEQSTPASLGIPFDFIGTCWGGEFFNAWRAVSDYQSVTPREGDGMAVLEISFAEDPPSPVLNQLILFPAGVQTLSFDFNYFGPLTHYTSVRPTAALGASIGTQMVLHTVQVPIASLPFQPTQFGCGNFICEQTGWQTLSILVSDFAGQLAGLFIASPIDAPTLLLDNIRFGTVWIDVKILKCQKNGSGDCLDGLPDNTADEERVQQNVRDANLILAQAGLNVRIRSIQTITDPGGLLDPVVEITDANNIDIKAPSGKLRRPGDAGTPGDVNTLLNQARSGTSSDVNVYYVRSLRLQKLNNAPVTLSTLRGISITSDDYDIADATTQRGIIIRDLPPPDPNKPDNRAKETLAHELGHLLISPAITDSALEHYADPGNIMTNNTCVPPGDTNPGVPCSSRAIMTPEQSLAIDRSSQTSVVMP